jgi:hypothetical protein
MSETIFSPFYERWAKKLGLGAVGKLLLSGGVTLAFFLPYYEYSGAAALQNYSWLLALSISFAPLFLFYATATLNNLLPLLKSNIEDSDASAFMAPLNSFLRDRNFLLAGLFFGVTNVAMGILFGVDMGDPTAAALLFFGFFLAGFVCGLPAMGIFGVVASFRRFTNATRLKLDYTAPDRCGGLSFLGVALVKFSIVTLLEGILIACYILLAEWTRADDSWVQLLMWVWVIFPFLLSLLVLIIPAIDLNLMLSRYRHQQEEALKARCSQLRDKIDEADVGVDRENLRSAYDYLCRRREEAHSMRTWPFSIGATTSFVAAFLSNVVVAVEIARSLLA